MSSYHCPGHSVWAVQEDHGRGWGGKRRWERGGLLNSSLLRYQQTGVLGNLGWISWLGMLPSILWFLTESAGAKCCQVLCDSLAGERIHGSRGAVHCKEDATVQTGLKLVHPTVILNTSLSIPYERGVYSGLGHSFSCHLWSSWWYKYVTNSTSDEA